MSEVALAVAGLTVRRGEKVVLREVTFEVARGDIVALVGPSGAGKSTLLRVIQGLERAHAGTVTCTRVGIVFQQFHLFDHMTALENVIEAPIQVQKRSEDEARTRAKALLERLGIWERRDALPRAMSGGEQQRVAIARALAMDPSVLLLDEPTASLDPERREDVAAVVRELEGTTAVLVVTHDMPFAKAVAKRTLLLKDGALTSVEERSADKA